MFGKAGQLHSKEQLDIIVHYFRLDLVELEDVRDKVKWTQTKPGAKLGFGPPGDEELDTRYFVRIPGEYRQDGGCGFFIPALVERVDYNEGPDLGNFERTNDDFLHLEGEGLQSDIRVHSQDLE